MTAATIERYGSDVSNEELIETLDRDGCAIVVGALSSEQLAGMNADLEELIVATLPGAPTALDSLHDFFGFDTIRIDGLPGKSKTYVDVLQLPLLLAAADHFLLSTSLSYLLNTGQLIEIHPGQTAQVLHRDEQGWMECVSDK